VVDKALGGVKPHLMMTDAPYGVEYDAAWRKESRRFLRWKKLCGQKPTSQPLA
jgi:hypothetical protein